jgi:arsenate reductase
MAEAFLNQLGGGNFKAESAGLEPGKMNQNVVKVMLEAGIDLSHKSTRGVFELLKKGNSYDAVITVCDEASAEQCPVFPGSGKRVAWSFADPSSFKGSQEEILSRTRQVRDEIEKSVRAFVNDAGDPGFWKQ